jgi:hypothetical protein
VQVQQMWQKKVQVQQMWQKSASATDVAKIHFFIYNKKLNLFYIKKADKQLIWKE